MNTSLSAHEASAEEYAAALESLARPDQPTSFLQAPFYGEWQFTDGKTVVYFTAEDDHTVVAAGLAIKYDAPGGHQLFLLSVWANCRNLVAGTA